MSWQFIDIVGTNNGQHREVTTTPPQFFRELLDDLVPDDAIVLRSGNEFCLDMQELGQRYPMLEPMCWHQFVRELQPSQVA